MIIDILDTNHLLSCHQWYWWWYISCYTSFTFYFVVLSIFSILWLRFVSYSLFHALTYQHMIYNHWWHDSYKSLLLVFSLLLSFSPFSTFVLSCHHYWVRDLIHKVILCIITNRSPSKLCCFDNCWYFLIRLAYLYSTQYIKKHWILSIQSLNLEYGDWVIIN